MFTGIRCSTKDGRIASPDPKLPHPKLRCPKLATVIKIVLFPNLALRRGEELLVELFESLNIRELAALISQPMR